MAGNDDEALHEFITGRYGDLRRSAFLMCGDWSVAADLTEAALASFVTESARAAVADPDAYVYAELMLACQKSRPRREHLFVAPEPATAAPEKSLSDSAGVADGAEEQSAGQVAVASVEGEAAVRSPRDPGSAGAVGSRSGRELAGAEDSVDGGGAVRSRFVQDSASAVDSVRGRNVGEVAADAVADDRILPAGADSAARAADSADGRAGASDAAGAAGGDHGMDGPADPIRTILVLDALHKLAPRCRAVMVLRHWDGFAVDETADILDLPDERVEAYEAAGLAAMERLLAEADAAVAA